MQNKKIAIIGGGNLGTSIAKGLNRNSFIPAKNITITRRNIEFLDSYKSEGFQVTADNLSAVKNADYVILVVKPYFIEDVARQIAPALGSKTILISLAAGITLQQLSGWTGLKSAIFRGMPNTAMSIGESMTFVSSFNASAEQENEVVQMFDKMGKTLVIPETQMSAATVLASCGIAYALRYIRASQIGGVEIGFNAQVATQIVAQTVKGAAELILQNGSHPEIEIDKVTTPGGITIVGLNEMEHQGFSSSVIQGLIAAQDKATGKK